MNLLNLNSFVVQQFPIGLALQITWTVKCYELTSTPEKLCEGTIELPVEGAVEDVGVKGSWEV